MKNTQRFDPTKALLDSGSKNEHLRRQRLGTFFRDYRLAAGLSQEQVARELCFSDSAADKTERVQAYEAGAESISLENIFALTMLLNIPPEEVLGLIYDVYQQGQVGTT